MLITNAFSLNFLTQMSAFVGASRTISIEMVDKYYVQELELESAIGHVDTANVVSSDLGVEVPFNRVSLSIESGEIIVAQYIGERLPEGATTLPEGSRIAYFLVSISELGDAHAC